MPHVHNGIGTWYYGKKNLQTRQGICSQCGKSASLSSYDTRLYFVIFFIPIIPLGRKHILDDCSSCRRHRVSALGEWEKAKRKAIDEGLAKMAADPNNADAAKSMHSVYLYFGERADADKLLNFMKDHFAQDAGVQFYIGGALEYIGRGTEANACFERALQLNPEMPEAKRAVGMGMIEFGKLDEARTLLKFIEEGKLKDPPVLYQLGSAFQRAGRHKEALELFGVIVKQAPALSQDKVFRKTVLKSEKELGTASTILPPKKRNLKAIIGWSVAAAVVVGGLLFWNVYVYTHQTLYIVSGLKRPVTVDVEGCKPVVVNGAYPASVELSEGRHHVVVHGGSNQALDIDISNGFFGRYYKSPVFVLNVDGSRLLVYETTVYAKVVVNEGHFELLYGQPFVQYDDIDYAFKAFPPTLTLDKHSSRMTKSRVGTVDEAAFNIFFGLALSSKEDEALRFGEWHLSLHPDDEQALSAYVAIADAPKFGERAKNYLKEGCKRRPVEIRWHRYYQSMAKRADSAGLEAEYEALLKGDPENSALLYLRGRLYEQTSKATALYEKSIEKDPKNPYPHYAMGYRCMNHGDWAGARKYMGEAVALAIDGYEFNQSYNLARFAVGEYADLEKEIRAEIAKSPTVVEPAERLVDVLLAQNKKSDAQKAVQDFESRLRADPKIKEFTMTARLRAHYLYVAGDFPALEKLTSPRDGVKLPEKMQQKVSKKNPDTRVEAIVEQGRFKELAQLSDLNNAKLDPFFCLALSIAGKSAGDDAGAAAWFERGRNALKGSGYSESVRISELLSQNAPPELESLLDLAVGPQDIAIVLTVLSQRFPEKAAQFSELARKLNIEPSFPHHLLTRVLGN